MATRKKIKEPQYEPDNGLLTSNQVEQLKTTTKKSKAKKESEVWPKVTVGSHLTVTTYENGKTELKWDDEALARDVREALENYENPQTKSKRARKK
jgi:hypothetical protein